MRRVPAFFSGLACMAFLSSCADRVEIVGHRLQPLLEDGVSSMRMNSLADQPAFSGEWSPPRLAPDQTYIRVLQKPGGSVFFRALHKEGYVIQVRSRGSGRKDTIRIGDKDFPLVGKSPEVMIGPEAMTPGTNEIKFSVEDDLMVSSIRIFPQRISGLAGADQALRDENVLFLPGSLKYYLKPMAGERLLLSIETGRANEVDVSILIKTESKTFKTKNKIRSRNDFIIRPVPGQFQEIEVVPRLPHTGFVRIKKSLLVRDRRPGTLRRIKKAARNKSILIISLDAGRADHISALGYFRRTTPSIDRMARESWVFADALAEAAFTLASTTTLHTGWPPDFHRVLSTFTSSLGPKQATLAELFRKQGYFTAAISANPYFGRAYHHDRGFAEFIELFEGAKQVMAADFIKPFRGILERAEGKPFFIYLHFREPHQDYTMPPPYLGTFQKKFPAQNEDLTAKTREILANPKNSREDLALLRDLYDENLLYADSVIGDLLAILDERKLDGQTIKIVTSDHGEGLGEHGMIGHNVDLQAEGIQIPLLVRIPGIPPKHITRPAISSDVAVTLAELFDLDLPSRGVTWGMNLFNLPPERRRLTRALNSNGGFPGFMVEQYPYRMILFFPVTQESAELYNIRDDPGQMNPLPAEGLVAETLRFIIRTHLKNADMDVSASRPANLREKDLQNLKSLGYIHQ